MHSDHATASVSITQSQAWEDSYRELLAAIRAQPRAVSGPLLITDASGLYDLFLAALPDEVRQVYRCRACRQFVERFGGLVTVGQRGEQRSWLWHAPGIPAPFAAGVRAMARAVDDAPITGAFVSSERAWGMTENTSRRTGQTWHHLAVAPPLALVFAATPIKTAAQAAAEVSEERGMVERALADFTPETAIKALSLLKGGNLYRSEKAQGIATWFVELHDRVRGAKGAVRDRLLWSAAAASPPGFAHLRGGMLGTLLEDVQEGAPFEALRARWQEKMSPLRYQRPQAAPSAGNIAAAEKIVSDLGIAGALDRRFARLDDVRTLWAPSAPPPAKPGGVFSHLIAKGEEPTQATQPPVVMTFAKFRREVLPEAEHIDVKVAPHDNFIALVTTVDQSAPPILQWDRPDRRNPVNWYLYSSGSPASQWGLAPGWVTATALTLLPSMWGGEDDQPHHGKGVIAILAGCRDDKDGGIALFPEVLKSEYRAIRSTIEAYSRGAKLAGRAEASACGLDLRGGMGRGIDQQIRVTDRRGAETVYKLDRWD